MRVGRLARSFSHSRFRAPISPALEASLERDAAELPTARVLRRANREFEPLRSKLGFIGHRLANMLDPASREPGYASLEELRDDLWLVLESVGSEHVARGSLRRLLWQVDVFGFHVAGLDVRQSAAVVQEAVGAAARLPRRRRGGARALLEEAIAERSARPGPAARGPGGRAAARARHGRARARCLRQRAVPVMVISMVAPVRRARGSLARAPRRGRAAAGTAVQTLADLRAAPATMAACTTAGLPRRAARHAGRQLVMLGYSDSGKDSGFVSSQWARTSPRSSSPSRPRRPGWSSSSSTAAAAPVARGGLHAPRDPRAAAGLDRRPDLITEQGETISARYGDAELAIARSSRRCRPCYWRPRASSRRCAAQWRAEVERIADACRRYRALVYDDPDFARSSSRRPADRADRAQHRLAPCAARPAGSRRCARSRGCSHGRRTGCCCRPW